MAAAADDEVDAQAGGRAGDLHRPPRAVPARPDARRAVRASRTDSRSSTGRRSTRHETTSSASRPRPSTCSSTRRTRSRRKTGARAATAERTRGTGTRTTIREGAWTAVDADLRRAPRRTRAWSTAIQIPFTGELHYPQRGRVLAQREAEDQGSGWRSGVSEYEDGRPRRRPRSRRCWSRERRIRGRRCPTTTRWSKRREGRRGDEVLAGVLPPTVFTDGRARGGPRCKTLSQRTSRGGGADDVLGRRRL